MDCHAIGLCRNLCFGNNIVQFFKEIKHFTAIVSCDERSKKFDDVLFRCTKVASSKILRVAECVAILHIQYIGSIVINSLQRYTLAKIKNYTHVCTSIYIDIKERIRNVLNKIFINNF